MTKGLGRLYLGVYYVAEPAVFGASAGCAIRARHYAKKKMKLSKCQNSNK
jgi:hypothetical protein